MKYILYIHAFLLLSCGEVKHRQQLPAFDQLELRVANHEMQGKKQFEDFEVFIFSEKVYKAATKDKIKEWLKDRFKDEGTYTPFEVTGNGVYETRYVTTEKTYDAIFLIVDQTSQPVIDWNARKRIVEVSLVEGDNTAILREQFNEDNTTYKLPKDSRAFTLGVLETDKPSPHGIQLGAHGIIRIDGRKHIEIDGNNATLWNDKSLTETTDYNNTGKDDKLHSYNRSQRKFLKLYKSDYVHIHDINLEQGNIVEGDKYGKPRFIPKAEFEHLLDARFCQYIALENIYGKGLWGDGIYIRDSYDFYLRNVTIDWNGRQGGAMISGGRAYLEKYRVLNSRRSGFDIEGNYGNDDTDGFVITYSEFNNHLTGLAMGGRGLVKNVLVINTIYHKSSLHSEGNGVDRLRENMMFVNSKARDLGVYTNTSNVLIDGIEQDDLRTNDLVIGTFWNCKNVTIRNIDIPTYGYRWKSEEPFILVRGNGTPIEEFKIYNNAQKIGIVYTDIEVRADQVEPGKWYFKKDWVSGTSFADADENFPFVVKPSRQATVEDLIEGGTVEDLAILHPIEFPEEYLPTEEEAVSIPFDTDNEWIDMHWKRLYGKSWKPELYEDDGWRPVWYSKL